MKKKTISFILVLALALTVLPWTLVTHAHASTDETLTREEQLMQQSYMYYYFANLGEHIEENVVGTCGYIALGMLLTYYDTYWDDNLVSNSYMVSDNLAANNVSNETMLSTYLSYPSPGFADAMPEDDRDEYSVRWDAATTEQKPGIWNEYRAEMIQQYAATSLQAALISSMYQTQNGPNLTTGGTTSTDREAALEQYFVDQSQREPDFDATKWEIVEKDFDTTWGDNYIPEDTDNDLDFDKNEDYVRHQVISYIRQGYPVMVGLFYYNNTSEGLKSVRHVAIAYDYDTATDTIYVNMGYDNVPSNMHKNVNTIDYYENTHFVSYMVLVPKGEHVHSNAYLFDDAENGACSCALPNHQHGDYVSYTSVSSTEHRQTCWCGQSELAEHIFVSHSVNQVICTGCGFIKLIGIDVPVIRPLNTNEATKQNPNDEEETE